MLQDRRRRGVSQEEDLLAEERNMARIIVTPDEQSDVVLFDEHVYPIHLENQLSSLQVAERLAWAVEDAEATRPAGDRRRITLQA
jgi:hypothetical protein